MKYYIIGCGGLAKEVLFLSKEVFGSTSNFQGFIDVNPKVVEITIGDYSYPVFDQEFVIPNLQPDCNMYIGIANSEKISIITQRFARFNFPNLIHPNVIYDKEYVNLGIGNIISPGCIFTIDISIGSFNFFNTRVTLGHDVKIGSFNVFQPNVQISGFVKIGHGNTFGLNSSVLQLKKIGNYNNIGANSLLMKNISDKKRYFGVPAMEIKI